VLGHKRIMATAQTRAKRQRIGSVESPIVGHGGRRHGKNK
jgi:hypothetical protein